MLLSSNKLKRALCRLEGGVHASLRNTREITLKGGAEKGCTTMVFPSCSPPESAAAANYDTNAQRDCST